MRASFLGIGGGRDVFLDVNKTIIARPRDVNFLHRKRKWNFFAKIQKMIKRIYF